MNRDTIAAIATPLGLGGIGIVRISGPCSREIALRLFRPERAIREFESHHLYLGRFMDPSSGQMIDEVLLSFMKAPHSFTREDVVEINSHSGPVLLSTILQIILDEGARLARPGEFSFRAFSNGRIDLTQAEAIVDIINAKSEKGLVLASRHARGELGKAVERLREKALELLARIEVEIDFPEEESLVSPREEMAAAIENGLIQPIERIQAAYARRKIWMEGIGTVIAGRVNAGKSSLLNRLLNEQRALVTPVPGTTRDVIESTIYIHGLPFRLMDTAGIRKVRGKVERMGVRLSEKKLTEADLSLILIDQSRPLNSDDLHILSRSQRNRSLIIINKIDLPSRLNEVRLKEIINGLPVARISALTGQGIEILYEIIRDMAIKGELDNPSLALAPNVRHRKALMEASENFNNAVMNSRKGNPPEIITIDLKCGIDALAEIIGVVADDELYERIFSEFCLGK